MLAKVKVDVKELDVAYRCKLEEFRVQVALERRVQTGEHASKDVSCQISWWIQRDLSISSDAKRMTRASPQSKGAFVTARALMSKHKCISFCS